jgi:ABC-2 type transport system permease protein
VNCRVFVNINPVTHLVAAVRGVMAGSVLAGELTWVLLACVALTAIFAPLTIYLYRNRQ